LKIVAAMIQELFSGRETAFLKYDMLFLGEELKARLHQQRERLSELEKQVICCIGNKIQPVAISQIREKRKCAIIAGRFIQCTAIIGKSSID